MHSKSSHQTNKKRKISKPKFMIQLTTFFTIHLRKLKKKKNGTNLGRFCSKKVSFRIRHEKNIICLREVSVLEGIGFKVVFL